MIFLVLILGFVCSSFSSFFMYTGILIFEIFPVSLGKHVSLYSSLLELVLVCLVGFWSLLFCFYMSLGIFWFPIWFPQWSIGCLVTYFLVSLCLWVFFFFFFCSCCYFSLQLISRFLALWLESMLNINFPKFTNACFLDSYMIHLRQYSVYSWKECVFCCFQMECVCVCILGRLSWVQLFATLWTVAH